MAKEIRTIGVMTSGGDSQGMNACVRAVVRSALNKGLKVKGIYRGFSGLMNGLAAVSSRFAVSSAPV